MLLHRERADRVMDEQGLVALVASSPMNVYYLTDWQTEGGWAFPGLSAAVLPRAPSVPPAVVTVDVDTEFPQEGATTWVDTVRTYHGIASLVLRHEAALAGEGLVDEPAALGGAPAAPVTAVAALLGELAISGRVGFEDPWFGQRVRDAGAPDVEVVAAADLLRKIRMVKTPDELSLLRTAARKTELAQLTAIEAVAAGATWPEAQRVFFSVMSQIGGEPRYLAGSVTRPGAGPLTGPDALERRSGDTAFFDSFGGYRHYFGDVGRTVVFGEPSERQRTVFAALRTGWRDTWSRIRPGMDSREVAAMVMELIRGAGASDYMICSPHSVGLEHFDHPHPGSVYEPFTVEPDMVLSVDLPYASDDTGMFHTEDLVLVRDDGVELLTSNDDRLFVAVDGRLERVD